MAKIAVWGRHTFEISATKVYGFEELKIKAQRKTKDEEKDSKTFGKQTITTKDASQPVEVSLKAKLYAALGIDPKTEARAWLEDAHKGTKSKLTVNGKEIVYCELRLVSAEVSEISINAKGGWTSCEVSCSFKQATRWTKSSTGSTSSSKKSSTKKSSKSKKTVKKSTSTSKTANKIGGISIKKKTGTDTGSGWFKKLKQK